LKAVENETGAGDRAVAKMRLVADPIVRLWPGARTDAIVRVTRAFRVYGASEPGRSSAAEDWTFSWPPLVRSSPLWLSLLRVISPTRPRIKQCSIARPRSLLER